MPDAARRTTARAGRALALVLVTALAAACGGIPHSGSVHAGAQLDGPPPVRVLAAPPEPGATAAEIVRGFLRAQPGLDDDAAVARSYLVGEAARRWGSGPTVVVYPDESSLKVTAGANGAYTVSTSVDATVDGNGIYTTAQPGAKATLKLQLVRVAGQWRISQLDNNQTRWLTHFDLDQVYAQVPVYYGVAGSRVLVPDLRWFPATSGLATAVARAQLQPPPTYLRNAVISGIPVGTSLSIGSVPTVDGVATIDLSAAARLPGLADRTLLWAQLAAAVAQSPGVVSVRVLAGGKLLELAGQSLAGGITAGGLGYSVDASPSSSAIALSTAGGRSDLTQLASGIGATSSSVKATLPSFTTVLRSLARSSDGREFAGVDATGRQLLRVVGGRTTPAITTPGGLTSPSYDSRRWLWTVSSGPGLDTRVHAVLTADGSRDVTDVQPSAPWLVGRQVTAFRVSRDGARAVVASTGRGGWRLDVTGIQRDARGRPVALTEPLRVGLGLADLVDATWVDATRVAVLGERDAARTPEPYLVTVGAETEALRAVAGGVPIAIAAGDGPDSVTLVTAKGVVLGRGGSTGWVAIGKGVGVAFPG